MAATEPLDFYQWKTEHFYGYLKEKLDGQHESDLEKLKGLMQKNEGNDTDDEKLLKYVTEMNADNLQQEGLEKVASHDIAHWIQRLCKIPKEPKVFNDPIHGHIEIPPLLIRIIDTPEFQRLRNIKQLGGAYWVFPGAAHNRFEHSLGVAYLAGELVRTLQRNQTDLHITERDILCVQIAGLCHDLGHGPFSHLYDGVYMKMLQSKKDDISKWQHEDASVEMLEYLVKKNHLQGVLRLHGLSDLEKDLNFIGSLIKGEPTDNEKGFLYQIVSNKDSGIDVDKWDYFARDSYHLGMTHSFDHERLLKFVRVYEDGGKQHICFREKEATNLYNMFHTRYLLHCRAFQHPVCKIIEYMIAEAFEAADEHFLIKGSKNQTYKLSTAIMDMEAYAKLTDSIFDRILYSDDPHLEKAKKILEKITCRDLYKLIGESPPLKSNNITKDDVEREMRRSCGSDDFCVHEIIFDYGKKSANPLDHVYFFNKKKSETPFKLEKDKVSNFLPDNFEERVFRVYCKKAACSALVQEAWKRCNAWINTQKKCDSCTKVPDTSGWAPTQPEVKTENDVSTYTLSSPAGSYECLQSGLRWSCAAPVTLKYYYVEWGDLKDMLAEKDLKPAGPLMDIKVLEGNVGEIHLPHVLCLENHYQSAGEVVQVLHRHDGGESLENCDLTRGHAKIVNPTFSRLGAVCRVAGFFIPIHCELQFFQSNTSSGPCHAHMVANLPPNVQTLHQQEERRGMRFLMSSGPFQVSAEAATLQTSRKLAISSGSNLLPAEISHFETQKRFQFNFKGKNDA